MARLLDPNSDLHAQLQVLTSEGVATSAIEGERFDPNALRSSLARRLGSADRRTARSAPFH
jgi:hypothetical protein